MFKLIKVVESHNFSNNQLCLEINQRDDKNLLKVFESQLFNLIDHLCFKKKLTRYLKSF